VAGHARGVDRGAGAPGRAPSHAVAARGRCADRGGVRLLRPRWQLAGLRRRSGPGCGVRRSRDRRRAGRAGAPDQPGLLALREGPLLEATVRTLGQPPDVLLVDATGRDLRAERASRCTSARCWTFRRSALRNRPLAAEGGVAGRRARRQGPAPPERRAGRLLAAHARGHSPARGPRRVADRPGHSCQRRPLGESSANAGAAPTSPPRPTRSPVVRLARALIERRSEALEPELERLVADCEAEPRVAGAARPEPLARREYDPVLGEQALEGHALRKL
jgi:hypothetical protein